MRGKEIVLQMSIFQTLMMKTTVKQLLCFLLLLGLVLIIGGCQSGGAVTTNDALQSTEDKTCRETIQKLYSIETYFPDNLVALQNLFTNEFNNQNNLTLERCSQVSRYEVLTLLSEDDPDFLDDPDDSKSLDLTEYTARISIISKSGDALGNNPSLVWLHMKIDQTGECKIDSIHGGG